MNTLANVSAHPPLCSTVSEEEFRRMTFQVGFCTAEGVLLASDLKKTPLLGYGTPRHEPKIEISKSGNLAHCSAGDTGFTNVFIVEIEKEIRKGVQFTENDIATSQILEKCLRKAQRRDRKYRSENDLPKTRGGYTMLVFREDDALSFWTIDSQALVPEIKMVLPGDAITTGNDTNAAVFFVNRYGKQISGDLKEFIPLAVHSVLMAKNDHVDGLQIGLFSRNESRILTADELKPYIDLSNTIDSNIALQLKNVAGNISL
jgi:hypothetical protein